MNLTQAALRTALASAGLPASLWQLPDVSYETVSEAWVRDNWTAWLEARPDDLVVFRDAGGKRIRSRPLWIAEASDCDNLALGVVAHGDVGNALASLHVPAVRGGLAFGVLFYVAETARPGNFGVAGGHAINWFVTHDGAVGFFEPGVGEPTDLNTTERSTAWFGLAA